MKKTLYIFLLLSIFACTEEIDKSNRYVFTGETVADFMLNRSEKYSHMITLMKRAGLLTLLQTYGQYTLFLPDNESVEKFVAEQDSIYWATRDAEKPINTGVTSPLVEELSDSMANVIARMHLIENRNYHTADMGEGVIGKWNFNDRALSVSYKVVNERFYIMINNDAAITDGDNQVENGIVHLIDKPIDPKYIRISSQISEYRFFSIFNQAIGATGFAERVSQTADPKYKRPNRSLHWKTLNMTPKQKYFKFTAFIEPDEIFHKNGIYTLDDLIIFAEKWYGTEEKGNYKNPKNALYKFVAYHFVEGEIPYNRVVYSEASANYAFNYISGYDTYNYYPTLQGTLLKALKPLSTSDGLNIYLNYSKRKLPYNLEMRNHTNVRIIELTEFTQMNERYANFVPAAGNGLIHPIDKILIYNEDEMVGNILNERMRFDIASLQPELSSNNIWQTDYAEIPIDYCKGIKTYVGDCSGEYSVNTGDYMGDYLMTYIDFDYELLLPPVPPRTYEIRISVTSFGLDYKYDRTTAKFQVYFDGKLCCDPLSMSIVSDDPDVNWVADSETYDNGVENDKHMRNLGWMKAPDVYTRIGTGIPARDDPTRLRKIIHRHYLSDDEHWLRLRYFPPTTVVEVNYNALLVDYIELVPLHIVSDPNNPEDRH